MRYRIGAAENPWGNSWRWRVFVMSEGGSYVRAGTFASWAEAWGWLEQTFGGAA